MLIVWSEFFACVVLILVAGVRLSRYGDVIAEKTGVSRTWVGLILLATVTSLPELVTGISAVALANLPNIALGDALGSCVFNLLIITVLDFLYREESVFIRARLCSRPRMMFSGVKTCAKPRPEGGGGGGLSSSGPLRQPALVARKYSLRRCEMYLPMRSSATP